MKKAGRIQSWHADKGYGFINVHDDLKDIFCHVTSLKVRAWQPKPGDRVSFELAKGNDGRLQAVDVTIVGKTRARESSVSGMLPFSIATLALACIIGASLTGLVPRHAGAVCAVLSALTFVVYAVDKDRATRHARRVPEANLHMMALFGGWPGALAAQHLLRHKNRKAEFQWFFRATVVIHVGALAAWKTILAT